MLVRHQRHIQPREEIIQICEKAKAIYFQMSDVVYARRHLTESFEAVGVDIFDIYW